MPTPMLPYIKAPVARLEKQLTLGTLKVRPNKRVEAIRRVDPPPFPNPERPWPGERRPTPGRAVRATRIRGTRV